MNWTTYRVLFAAFYSLEKETPTHSSCDAWGNNVAYDVTMLYKPASIVAQCMQVPIFLQQTVLVIRPTYVVQLSVSDSETKALVKFSTSSLSSPESPARLPQPVHSGVLIAAQSTLPMTVDLYRISYFWKCKWAHIEVELYCIFCWRYRIIHSSRASIDTIYISNSNLSLVYCW